MAKTKAAATTPDKTPIRATLDDVSSALRNKLKALKGAVLKVAGDYEIVRKRVAERAGEVMKLFKSISAEMEDKDLPFTMADFARMFDPSVPYKAGDKDNPGYTTNPTYIALTYMKRVRDQAGKPKGDRGVTDPATNWLARAIATVLTGIKPESHDVLYNAIQSEMTENGIQNAPQAVKRLRKRVADAKPLIDLSARLKPISIEGLHPVHQASIKAVAGASVVEHPSTKAMRAAAERLSGGVAARGAVDLRRRVKGGRQAAAARVA